MQVAQRGETQAKPEYTPVGVRIASQMPRSSSPASRGAAQCVPEPPSSVQIGCVMTHSATDSVKKRASLMRAAPYVGAHSPEILVDSVIYHDIDWKSLALEAESLDDAENRLRAIFGKSSIAGLVADVNGVTLAQLDDESFKPRRYLQASHSVITLNDKFVSIPSMMRLHHGLVKACPEGKAKYTEVVGGHLLAWLRRKTLQVDAINEPRRKLKKLSNFSRSSKCRRLSRAGGLYRAHTTLDPVVGGGASGSGA
eukprot:scaffold1220_cov259-Pinguiococcus_pyrenoidosus.AAC.119